MTYARWIIAIATVNATIVVARAGDYLGPETLLASHDDKTVYVALANARQLSVFDVASKRIIDKLLLPAEPTALALSPDGKRLYVTCAAPRSTITVIDAEGRKIIDSISAGHTAHGMAVSPDGTRLYVCNRFDNDVSVIDVAGHKTIARVPVTREPYAAVATADGKTVFVANHLPLDRADGSDVAAVVSAINTVTNQASSIRLPNGSSSVRGMCLAADGRYLFVVHVLSHYQLPATQVERGWENTNALSIIDVSGLRLFATVLLDDIDCGAALPWSVAASGDGHWIFVTHAGTHEISQIDAAALMKHLSQVNPADAINDLALMARVRRRIALPGNGPRGVSIASNRVFVSEYFGDALAVIDLNLVSPANVAFRSAKEASLSRSERRQSQQVAIEQVPLGPPPHLTAERRGEMLFHDATLCFQHWQSCASCHPDVRADGLNWDLPNDGLGNPKNTRSLLGVFHGGAAMSLGVRENAAAAVRAGIAHILYAQRPEEDAQALDAYLKSLEPVPSPRLVDSKLSAAAQHGKELFFSPALDCAECHPPPYYSDNRAHSVGSQGKFDKPNDHFNTPRLTEAWRTAPYMHDGHYLTIRELLSEGKHGLRGEGKPKLSAKDIEELSEFVESL